jgi:IS30 family transposase
LFLFFLKERGSASGSPEKAAGRMGPLAARRHAMNGQELLFNQRGVFPSDWEPVYQAIVAPHPEDEYNQVSHETIYRSLFVQARGVLKKELLCHLRSKRSMRRSRPVDPNGDRRGHMKDAVSIRQRPAAVEDRAVPGHWEGDLLSGPNNTYIATLVERQTRYVMLAKVAGKDTRTVVNALIKQAKKLPKELYKSLTWDRGKELTDHRRFTMATNIDVYFCDPQSPWQRGSNENTNGLLRQYFPQGTDLSVHSQAHLNKVARQLNERPRETLQFKTPAERFNACVASTGWAGNPEADRKRITAWTGVENASWLRGYPLSPEYHIVLANWHASADLPPIPQYLYVPA